MLEEAARIPVGNVTLEGTLASPSDARGIVLFVHGSGSSRHSPRNRFVAHALHNAGLATLLFDLLTSEEEEVDIYTRQHRFDISLLAQRLGLVTAWVRQRREVRDLRIGYFGSSTGGGAALVAAAERPDDVSAVVSRGGRPDLAGAALGRVLAPSLLIVGGNDESVAGLNRQAIAQMHGIVKLAIVSGASHLFEEPGALEEVAQLAADWFHEYLR